MLFNSMDQRWMSVDAGDSVSSWVGAVVPGIRFVVFVVFCAPEKRYSRRNNVTGSLPVFADERHVQVEATWGVYQRMIAAYRHPEPAQRGALMKKLIVDITAGVPQALKEICQLGRTLKRRAVVVLAYFDRPGTSNGPTEAINGRLDHLRGTALGFRNLRNYIARTLLEAGGFRPQLHP